MFLDVDQDGYGDANVEYPYDIGRDCDDSNISINEEAVELCDGVDNIGNGYIDGVDENDIQ